MTVADLITLAYTEIRVARAGDALSAEKMTLGLQLYQSFLDAENADRREVWMEQFSDFTLTPALNPHTIGPSGATWTAPRPVSITAAQVNLGGGPPNVFRQLFIRDDRWYASLPIPGLSSAFPTDLFYDQNYPNGSLYFWPVPTSPYGIRLWMRVVITNVTNAAGTTFAMPPGYLEYHRLSLAEMLAPSNGQTLSAGSQEQLRRARERVFANNEETPALFTADHGLTGTDSRKSAFNWLNRSFE